MIGNLNMSSDISKDGAKKHLLTLESYSIDEFNKKFDLNIKEESDLDDFVSELNSSGIFHCSSAAENKDASMPTPVYVDDSSKETYKHMQVNNFITVVKVK
ncbi:hypothetical protein [Clostridium cylindrosporum]|uniref:Uncharacterized protein n=1 Tax=Clostridium cylindrosporum DSM 605 TaxID=1121307 RepID=A0A0J8DBC8_CLOCY|nr:hypothetical protein [Clostridium cylindrosporum]KMT21614.1 hypothetical protein CLCY_2c03760 [Clostridium cylindrosporum DSM 605]